MAYSTSICNMIPDQSREEDKSITKEEDLVSGSSIKHRAFDEIVGHLEDIVVDDKFQNIQGDFMDKYVYEFEDSEENKLSYTPIFNEYISLLEGHIEKELQFRSPNFDMKKFLLQLNKQQNEISEELFEMLASFTDFLAFKQLMIDHRAYREGKVADLSFGLTITPMNHDGTPR